MPGSDRWLTIPNALSVARIPLAALVALTLDNLWLCVPLFFAMALTDFLDGYLARRFGWGSKLGEVLDPIADRAMVFILVPALAAHYDLHLLYTLLWMSRDLLLVLLVAGAFLVGARPRIKARLSGKLTTCAQVATMAALLLGLPALAATLTLLVAALSAWAVTDYIQEFRRNG